MTMKGDDLSPEERHALNRSLMASYESMIAGELRPAFRIIDKLRGRAVSRPDKHGGA